MQEQVKHLIAEYEVKILQCDKMLAIIKEKSREARKSYSTVLPLELSADRREQAAKRQAYVQAIADFKSIIGEI